VFLETKIGKSKAFDAKDAKRKKDAKKFQETQEVE